MKTRAMKFTAVAAVLLLAATACSSSKKTPASTSSSRTYTIGILTDVTGNAASGNATTVQGAEAAKVLAAQDGITLNFVVGDTTSSAAGAEAAAQRLVEQDHVLAIDAVSAYAYGAASYLAAQGIPVVGVAEDGPEWTSAPNMFSAYGFVNAEQATTTLGQFFKMEGVTTAGALGYGISPASADAAKAVGTSAKAAGLNVGYIDASFPFGSTNVEPDALHMKSTGVNGLEPTVDPNTGFALIGALRQLGVDIKAAVLPTGYGGDLLQAGPSALSAAQGVFFESSFEPVEMNTAATKQFQSALETVGVTSIPTYAEYAGYAGIALLLQGLQGAGSSPTHASLISALSHITNFNAAGLLGTHTLNLTDRAASAGGVDGCTYMTKLVGSAFQLVPGADPICGTYIASS